MKPGYRLTNWWRVITVALAALLLTTCNIFYFSAFPPHVPLLSNQVDVSDRLPYDPAAEYRVECYDDGVTEYVFILAQGPELGEILVIYDEDLDEKFFREDSAAANEFSLQSPIATDTTRNVWLGTLQFGPGLTGPVNFGANNLHTQETLFNPAGIQFLSFDVSGISLNRIEIPNSPANAPGGPFGENFAGTGNFNRVAADYSIRSGLVGIAAFDENGYTVGGFVGGLSTFMGTNVTAATVVLSPGGYTFGYDSFPKELFVVPTGVVLAPDDADDTFVYHDFLGGEGPSLSFPHTEAQVAFSMAGDHFYIFQPENESLAKADTWW